MLGIVLEFAGIALGVIAVGLGLAVVLGGDCNRD
jgi:hypothetical protein